MICRFSAPFVSCCWFLLIFGCLLRFFTIICCVIWRFWQRFSAICWLLSLICHNYWPDSSVVCWFNWFFCFSARLLVICWTLHFVFDPVALFPRQVVLRFLGCFHHFSQSVSTLWILILCFRTGTFVAGFDPMALLWLGSCFDRPVLYLRIPVTVSPGPI